MVLSFLVGTRTEEGDRPKAKERKGTKLSFWYFLNRFTKRDIFDRRGLDALANRCLNDVKTCELIFFFEEFIIALFCPTSWVILKQLDPSRSRATGLIVK